MIISTLLNVGYKRLKYKKLKHTSQFLKKKIFKYL